MTLAEFLAHFLHSLFQNPIAALAQGNVLGDCREIARKLSDNMESHVQPD